MCIFKPCMVSCPIFLPLKNRLLLCFKNSSYTLGNRPLAAMFFVNMHFQSVEFCFLSFHNVFTRV